MLDKLNMLDEGHVWLTKVNNVIDAVNLLLERHPTVKYELEHLLLKSENDYQTKK